MISDLLAAAPLMLVPILLATGRVGALGAGMAGVAAAICAVWSMDGNRSPSLLGHAIANGLCISVQAILFILAGLFFYRCVRADDPYLFRSPFDEKETAARPNHRRLYAAYFLLGLSRSRLLDSAPEGSSPYR